MKYDDTTCAHERLEQYRDALNQHASVVVTNLNGVITFANQRCCDMSGYSVDELVGHTHAIVKSESHPCSVFKDLWDTIRSGSAWRGELCNRNKTGKPYWVETYIVPFKDESGAMTQYVSIQTDITEQKLNQERQLAAQAEARESEERLRQIADNLPALIAYWDASGICRFANQAQAQQLGTTTQRMIGRSLNQLLGNSYNETQQALVRTVMAGERQRFDWTGKGADHVLRHWQGDYLPHWIGGKVVGFYAHVVDITERKRAEQILARQTALLATTSRMGEIGGWELANGQTIPYFSDMLCRIHDLPLGQSPTLETAFDFYPPEARAKVRESIVAAFEHCVPFDYTVPFITATGRHRWIRSIGEPQVTDGRCVNIVGAIQDVTHQKHLEAELAQAQKLESIGQLSAGIAHEINTPTQFIGNNVAFVKNGLTDIFLLTDRLRELIARHVDGLIPVAAVEDILAHADVDYFRDELPRAIDQSIDGIDRIKKIVGAMKEFSHPSVEKTLLNINRAIESTVIVASNEWKYVAELKMNLDPDLPLVPVMPGGFNQAVLNLIVNAAHAIGTVINGVADAKGVITVTTRQVNDWAEVRIHDTGCGIPEDIRDRIFEQFFTTKPVGKGTGQGLAIAQDVIVNKHGGSIAVESEIGSGTAFVFRLPLALDDAQAEAAA